MELSAASGVESSTVPRSAITRDLLQRAIACGEVYPVFQPIVALPGGGVTGFEVLARWDADDIGSVAPALFIPLAERSGLAAPLMASLVKSACASALQWGGGQFQLAFNISPVQLRDNTLPGQIKTLTDRTGFPLSRIQLEVTESALIEDIAVARRAMGQLKELGVQLVLDDFGTGYSSLTWLQALPFDRIKIDASFVRSMTRCRDSRKIVSAMTGLGQSLGMPVVAEGVETTDIAWMLTKLGCGLGQGYLYGRPSRADAVPAVLGVFGAHSETDAPLNLSNNLRLAQLSAIYASAPIALCFVDMNGRFISANQKFAEMIDVDINRIVGRSVRDVRPDTLPLVMSVLKDIAEGKPPPTSESIMPDGKRNLLSSVSAAHDEDGEIVGISLAVVDITNYKASVPTRVFGRRAVAEPH